MFNISKTYTLICLFSILFASCGNSDETLQQVMHQAVQVDRIKNVTITVTENGVIKMFLTAPRLNKYNNDSGRFNFSKGLHIVIYNDSSKPGTYCRSKYGDYWKKTGLLFLRDSVVIWNDIGDTLISDELWWDRNAKKIYTDQPIHIYQPGTRMQGTCWHSNDKLTDYSICNMEGIYDNNKKRKNQENPF